MAVITITATGLGPQLISGIPLQVALTTNVPATLFYTLDGTAPTTTSRVYLSPILMPTDVSVRLRVWAVSGSDSGILDLTYSTNITDLWRSRRIEGYGAGIVVDAYNTIPILYDGYVAGDDLIVDEPARYSDYELTDLEIKYSRTGPNGEGEGTDIENGPLIQTEDAISFESSSPNNQNVYFNPRSMYITIDGRDGYEDQSVFIINRAYGDIRDMTKYLQGKTMYHSYPYIAGGHVKTFYTVKDGEGIACAYYFNHNETRWIKSIQKYDPETVPENIGDRRQFGPPLVFKWVYNKRTML